MNDFANIFTNERIILVPPANPQAVLVEATKNLHNNYHFFEITLQIEDFLEVMEDCSQCKTPVV